MLRAVTRLLAVALCVWPWPAEGRDERPQARLSYQVEPHVQGCPSDPELRTSIAARLGYDPFRSDAPLVVTATIRRSVARLVAVIEARDDAGALVGRRELESRGGDCAELGRAVALAVSVAIDPFVLVGAARAPRPDEGAAPPRSSEDPSRSETEGDDTAIETSASRGVSDLSLGLFAAVGVGDGTVPGLGPRMGVGGELRRRRIGVRLLAELDLPAEAAGPSGGEMSAFRIDGTLLACAYPSGWLVGCGGVELGGLWARSKDLGRTEDDVFFVSAGRVDLGVRFRMGRAVWLETAAGLRIAFNRVRLELNHEPTFTQALLAPWGGITVFVELP